MKKRTHKKQVNRYKRANLIYNKKQRGSHKRWVSQVRFDRFCESVPNEILGSAQHINMLTFEKKYRINIGYINE